METQNHIQANILIQIEHAVMHRLVSKEKTLYTEGVCKIAKIDSAHETPVYFLNINSFYYTLSKSDTFARLEFDYSVSYVFSHFDNGLSAITLLKDDGLIHNFQEIIKNVAELKNFDTAIHDEDFHDKVEEHCPFVDREPIFCSDKIKSTITWAGRRLESGITTVGDYVAKGVHYIGQLIESKVDEPANKPDVSPQIKSKWETLKNGTNHILSITKDIYEKYLSPIVHKGLEYGKSIDSKLEASQNDKIKYARTLACVSGNAVCTAFKGLSEGTNKVVGELGTQTRKIMKKKLGDDYVSTFLPEEQKENKQNCETPEAPTTTTTTLIEREEDERPLAHDYLHEKTN